MANPQDEIAWLTAQVASLTQRIYQLEKKAGLVADAPPHAAVAVPPAAPVAPLPGTMLQPPSPPTILGTPPHAAPVSPASSMPPAEPPSSPRYPAPEFQPVFRSVAAKSDPDLEKKIGQYWLNRVG